MSAREEFEALSPQDQRGVVEVFRAELARGWIPTDADLEAVIEAVRRH